MSIVNELRKYETEGIFIFTLILIASLIDFINKFVFLNIIWLNSV